MSEKKVFLRTSSAAPLHWRVRVCRWLWRGLAFVWGTLIAGIVIGTIANLNTTTTETPLAKLYIIHLVQTYPLLVWPGLGFLAILTLLSWLGSRDRQVTAAHSLSEQNRVHMLRRLHARYEQIRTQSLQGAVQMELSLALRPAAVQNAVNLVLRVPNQSEQPLPPHTSIIRAYELAQQELLILGEPGVGKSTLLLELARFLVAEAKQDVTQPLPILLPLSSWSTKHHSLDEWLSEEIARLYDVPRHLSQQWIAAEQVLPLLDGLDEMEAADRPTCIAAINLYHREHVCPLVICSRTDDYDQAAGKERLALHTAVVVRPLSPEQVDAHLAALGNLGAALRAALAANPTLAKLAMIPLMLQILILTYHGTSVKLLALKQGELQRQIWATFIERMVERKGDVARYPLDHTITTLEWLARQMRRSYKTIFSFEDGYADTLLPPRYYTLYTWSVWLGWPLIVGLSCALGARVIWPSKAGAGLFVGCLGLFFGLLLLGDLDLQDESLSSWLWRDARGTLLGLLFFPIIGLVGGLVAWLVIRLLSGVFGESFSVWLVGGSVGGPVAWLVGGLIIGLLFGVCLLSFLVGPNFALRFWLWCSPFSRQKMIPFFEDATARMFLRRVGRGYSFTHRLLQEYFMLDSVKDAGISSKYMSHAR